MKPQEIELWARDVSESVLDGRKVEDSRVELKVEWPEPAKAALRLGAHANASRGDNILWIIGVNEDQASLSNVDPIEKGDWYRKTEKRFDGFAPRLLADVNFKVNGNSLVALYFDTVTEAPFVVKNSTGGYPEYTLPWREGTNLRAASRENLLRVLVPVNTLSALIGELEFNLFIAKKAEGEKNSTWFARFMRCQFETSEFDLSRKNGLLQSLGEELKIMILEAYWAMKTANQEIVAAVNYPLASAGTATAKDFDVRNAISDSLPLIETALNGLKAAVQG